MGTGRQFVFVIETNKAAQIDVGYLNEILHHFYIIDRGIKINYVYMDGKYKYQHPKVKKEIKRYCKMYQGHTDIFYVLTRMNLHLISEMHNSL